MINSVSFNDGRKFHDCRDMYKQFRDTSDRICLEHGLSVIKEPKGRSVGSYLYKMERAGMPTRYNVAREKNKKESAGAKWTPEEDAQLIEEYKNSLSIKEIAEIHKWSEGSIQSRIVKLWQNQQLENEKMQ